MSIISVSPYGNIKAKRPGIATVKVVSTIEPQNLMSSRSTLYYVAKCPGRDRCRIITSTNRRHNEIFKTKNKFVALDNGKKATFECRVKPPFVGWLPVNSWI
uniref:Uncharacterized protein n=1 Tax=Brassica oleracea TaxID=3712 RepID=A0A3P6FPX4_BRAOL|nr:unnamed protein product [Brassica oleracea]